MKNWTAIRKDGVKVGIVTDEHKKQIEAGKTAHLYRFEEVKEGGEKAVKITLPTEAKKVVTKPSDDDGQ